MIDRQRRDVIVVLDVTWVDRHWLSLFTSHSSKAWSMKRESITDSIQVYAANKIRDSTTIQFFCRGFHLIIIKVDTHESSQPYLWLLLMGKDNEQGYPLFSHSRNLSSCSFTFLFWDTYKYGKMSTTTAAHGHRNTVPFSLSSSSSCLLLLLRGRECLS